jgi:hypothetical protein
MAGRGARSNACRPGPATLIRQLQGPVKMHVPVLERRSACPARTPCCPGLRAAGSPASCCCAWLVQGTALRCVTRLWDGSCRIRAGHRPSVLLRPWLASTPPVLLPNETTRRSSGTLAPVSGVRGCRAAATCGWRVRSPDRAAAGRGGARGGRRVNYSTLPTTTTTRIQMHGDQPPGIAGKAWCSKQTRKHVGKGGKTGLAGTQKPAIKGWCTLRSTGAWHGCPMTCCPPRLSA